jgi:hypothetical protein
MSYLLWGFWEILYRIDLVVELASPAAYSGTVWNLSMPTTAPRPLSPLRPCPPESLGFEMVTLTSECWDQDREGTSRVVVIGIFSAISESGRLSLGGGDVRFPLAISQVGLD